MRRIGLNIVALRGESAHITTYSLGSNLFDFAINGGSGMVFTVIVFFVLILVFAVRILFFAASEGASYVFAVFSYIVW
jgi:hypothetical protein